MERPSVARFDPSTTTWSWHTGIPVNQSSTGRRASDGLAAGARTYDPPMFKAVLWDFGGVILSSPFEAFNRYEDEHGLPSDFIRTVNATNPHTNAWARLERSDITPAEFDAAFADESEALGHRVPGADVLALLAGDVRAGDGRRCSTS